MDLNYPNNELKQSVVFPLYLSSKELIRIYNKLLRKYDLTYTQYIVLMYFKNIKESNLKRIGKIMMLDSSTLTPLLNKLENKGLITKKRETKDERNLIIKITKKGMDLSEKCHTIYHEIANIVDLDDKEIEKLHKITTKILYNLNEEEKNERN